MRRRALGVAIASLTLFTAACSGSAEDTVESAAGEVSEAAGDAAGEASEAAEPTDEATEAASGESTVLIGMVGSKEDPDAFEISLTDESGEPVTDLPAGDYTIQVTDASAMHNFHLTGGSVDEKTSVPDADDATFEVTLEPGDYTFKCDPHPPMTGSFTVS
jgi:plastocyanin